MGRRVWGASLIVLFALALLFSLFRPVPSAAQGSEKGYLFVLEPVFEGPASVYGLSLLNDAKIYVEKDGRAHAENTQDIDEPAGINTRKGSQTYIFTGRYDASAEELTGEIKISKEAKDWQEDGRVYSDISASFNGTLTAEFIEGSGFDGIAEGPYEMRQTVYRYYGEEADGGFTPEFHGNTDVYHYNFTASVTGKGGSKEDDETGTGLEEGGSAGDGSKIPGPGSWWVWLNGTVVAGIITAGIGLISSLFGSVPPPPDAPTLGPAGPYRETPGGPLIYPPGTEPPPTLGPAGPYRETPDGPLLNPPGSEPPPTLGPAKPYSETPGGPLTYPRPVTPTMPSGEPGVLDYTKAAGETLVDTVVATGKGAYDFFGGLIKAVGTGYSEIGGLAVDLYNHGPVDTIKELWNSPGIIGEAITHTFGEFIETVNPIEEIKALNDPNMSLEGKAWAVSCIAIKVANAILLKDSIKDLKNSMKSAPEEAAASGAEALKTQVKSSGRTSNMSQSEAIAQAEKSVPKESTAAYEAVKGEAKKAVDDFTAKVESGKPITTEDVLEVTKDPMVTREVLGKTDRPISSQVKKAVQEGRREIYKATDKQVATELQKSPKYAEGKIKPKEVSTGGEADAVKSTDRDVQYVYEKKVRGADGKTRTVREDVPAKDVKEIHDKAFADNTNFDPGEPPPGVDPEKWLKEQQAAHAERYGQNIIDRTSPEYIAEFSGAKGPGKITSDPQWKAHVYEKEKFGKLWEKPDPISKGEALEQLKKTGGEARKTAESAGKTIDQQTQDALDIVERGGDPAVVDQAIKNLGITNGAEGLSNRLGSIIESGKWSPK